MSAESGKATNIVQVIRSAVDRLPDSEAAQLDEAAKTVAALVEALKEASESLGHMGAEHLKSRADAALSAAGVVLS